MTSYAEFLERKRMIDPMTGLSVVPDLPAFLFPHQRDIVSWALRRGRSAIFAGTGLGKTAMELVWSDAVAKYTGKPVLIFAPLAVSQQHIREANKFGLSARIVKAHEECAPGVNVTNYQKIDHFDLSAFGGIVLDESSILKSTDGHYRTRIIEGCASIPFRLAATATPAPNDFMELGNHAEFLGVMSYTDMLATFFSHDGGETQKWRLKGHAENDFWKWMASWAVMLRQPGDLGYPNDGYDLPPLRQTQHHVAVEYAPSLDTGLLFPVEAHTLQERIAARRDTVEERVALAKQIIIGSFGDKLAAWYGSPNTPSAADSAQRKTPNIAPSETSNPLTTKIGGRNTCANIGPKTSKSGSARQSSRQRSTLVAESVMPTTLNIASAPNPRLENGRQNSVESSCCGQNTNSHQQNTTNCSDDKMASAQSAIAETAESGSTSTTATIKDTSGDSCAHPATPASDISKTTQAASNGQSNTFEKLESWVVWCHLNSEQDALEKAFGDLALSVRGSKSDEENERAILAFINGERPILIGKPSMLGFGLNLQCCHQTLFVGLNDSFEQVFQAIRRFWRFGQTKPVNAHFIAAETEGAVVANLRRKEADAERMAAAMVKHTASLSSAAIRGLQRTVADYDPQEPFIVPSWLEKIAC